MILADRLAGRDNNFALLRLVAALLVLFGHSFTLLAATAENPYPADPISRFVRHYAPFEEGLPGIGVHLFFFVSGLLVTRSFLVHSPRSFVAARLLRLLPGYWLSLIVLAFLVGPMVSRLPLGEYLLDPSLRHFLLYDVALWPMWGALPGVFETLPVAGAVNGPYWTLPLEAQMYAWCLGLGSLGLYRRRWSFSLFFAGIVLLYLRHSVSFVFPTEHGEPRLWHFFFLGTLSTLYADRIRLRWRYAMFLLLPLPVLHLADAGYYYHLWAAIGFCYAVLCLIYRHPLPSLDPSRLGDYSYGLYLYGFPVQQCLILGLGTGISGWLLFPLSCVAALVPAVLSWHFVERPALRLKARFALSDRRPTTINPAR